MGSKLKLTSDLFSRSDSGFITDELGLLLFFVPVCTGKCSRMCVHLYVEAGGEC